MWWISLENNKAGVGARDEEQRAIQGGLPLSEPPVEQSWLDVAFGTEWLGEISPTLWKSGL